MPKKFLDANGITHLVSLLDNYPDNTILSTVIDSIDELKADTNHTHTAADISSGTVAFARLPTIYWANIAVASSAAYNKTPELAKIKLNGNTSASTASSKNVELIYDSTNEVLNFVFN